MTEVTGILRTSDETYTEFFIYGFEDLGLYGALLEAGLVDVAYVLQKTMGNGFEASIVPNIGAEENLGEEKTEDMGLMFHHLARDCENIFLGDNETFAKLDNLSAHLYIASEAMSFFGPGMEYYQESAVKPPDSSVGI